MVSSFEARLAGSIVRVFCRRSDRCSVELSPQGEEGRLTEPEMLGGRR